MKKCRRIIKALLIIFAFLTNMQPVHSQSMSGTYSIGSASSDFSSFSQALDSLTVNGVSGPVILNVKNGTYNENISIGSINGASATNTITFQSLSADSTTVIITNTASASSNNYTIRLNGADYIRFRQITIRSVGAQYATAVQIQSNAMYNHFENCILEGSNVISTSTNLSVLYCASGSNSYNRIKNCVIQYGSYGIYYYGSSSPDILNNSFKDQYYKSMYIDQCSYADLIGNSINTNSTYSSYRAVELSNATYFTFSKNSISFENGSNGLYINSSSGSSVSNNFISVGGSSGSVDAVYCYDCSALNFYFNSVSIRRSGSSNTCFYAYKSYYGSSANIQLQNNIFANYGGGFCVDYNYGAAINLSDYNNFFTNGSYVGRWNGTSYNLSNWKLNTYKDANSLSIDPVFKSNSDLHVQNYLLDNKGLAMASITDDIDGESRSLSFADIGADEWTTPANDAGITDVDEMSTLCIVNDSVFVTLKNYGTDTLIAAQINWKVNNITLTPYSWTGSLLQGQTQGPFSVGYYDFSLGTLYSVVAWTSSPNGQAEGFSYNDQDAISNKYKAMSGTYTIGVSGADYQTFNAAITDLVNGGVCGPVIFNVKSGIYNEEVSINSISGVSSANTVTFQSQTSDSTDVTLTYTPNTVSSSTLKFNGCDYVIFKKMTIKAVGSQYATVIRLQNSSHNNSIEYCIVEGSNTNNTGTDLSVIYSSSSCNNFKLAHSRISNGSYGLYFNSGSSLLIENNAFVNQYYHPLYISSVSSPLISGNSISTNSSQGSFSGMYLNSSASYNIKNNRIALLNAGNYGIFLSSSNGGLCANNFI
jgi:parallel beta-helix repeat protein